MINIITLYSTGCPRCNVLKKKLEEKSIEYTEVTSIDEIIAMGFREVPRLKVGDEIMDYVAAVRWVNEQ